MEIHFGDTGVKTDISAGRSGTSLAARRRMKILTNTDPSNGPWLFDGSRTDFSDRTKFQKLSTASKGGETMRERGWLDAVFARAERAAMRGGRTRR